MTDIISFGAGSHLPLCMSTWCGGYRADHVCEWVSPPVTSLPPFLCQTSGQSGPDSAYILCRLCAPETRPGSDLSLICTTWGTNATALRPYKLAKVGKTSAHAGATRTFCRNLFTSRGENIHKQLCSSVTHFCSRISFYDKDSSSEVLHFLTLL